MIQKKTQKFYNLIDKIGVISQKPKIFIVISNTLTVHNNLLKYSKCYWETREITETSKNHKMCKIYENLVIIKYNLFYYFYEKILQNSTVKQS